MNNIKNNLKNLYDSPEELLPGVYILTVLLIVIFAFHYLINSNIINMSMLTNNPYLHLLFIIVSYLIYGYMTFILITFLGFIFYLIYKKIKSIFK